MAICVTDHMAISADVPTVSDGIPVIDLAAFMDVGFAYVINHGVEQQVIQQVMAQHKAFHAMPLSEKRKIELNSWHRGYLPMASYQLKSTHKNRGEVVAHPESEIKKPNQSESFIINHEHLEGPADATDAELAGRFLQGPNQWPQEGSLPGFRDDVLNYYEALKPVAMLMTRSFFQAANADFSKFAPDFERPSIGLRMLHYPPQPSPVPEGQYGSVAALVSYAVWRC